MARGKLKQPAKYSPKICAFCGKEFIPNSAFQKYCKGPHIRQCPVCGKDYVEDNSENLKRPPVACSYECRKKRREQTSMERYGIKAPGNNPDARKKAVKTCIEHHGVAYPMQSSDIRQKSKETLIDKYGVDNVGKSWQVQMKKQLAHTQAVFESNFPDLQVYESHDASTSDRQAMLEQLLNSCKLTYTKDETGKGARYTIAASNTVFQCIEHYDVVSGVSQVLTLRSMPQSDDSHLIFIYPWTNIRRIVRAAYVKTPIYARHCSVYQLREGAAVEFIERCAHTDTYYGTYAYYGLMYQKELVSVLSVRTEGDTLNVVQHVTHPNFRVIGGLSKLINVAVSLAPVQKIRVFSIDLAYDTGESYLGLGFIPKLQAPSICGATPSGVAVRDSVNTANYSMLQDIDNTGGFVTFDCGHVTYELALEDNNG